jgi:hypothetical protein
MARAGKRDDVAEALVITSRVVVLDKLADGRRYVQPTAIASSKGTQISATP